MFIDLIEFPADKDYYWHAPTKTLYDKCWYNLYADMKKVGRDYRWVARTYTQNHPTRIPDVDKVFERQG